MAKKSLARKRQTAAKRTTRGAKRANAPVRRSPARAARMGNAEMFNPSTWVSTLLGSQTGRKVVAEALVAAAAAAAGVLVASRTETGQKAGRALMAVGKRGGEVAKEAALSAAAAAADVITETAAEALHTASKSMLANALRDDDADDAPENDMAENARRQRERRAH